MVILIKDTKVPAIYGLGVGLTGGLFFLSLTAIVFGLIPPLIFTEPKIMLVMAAVGICRYILATWFFYESIKFGDVSVAAPIFGSKIIIVSVISIILGMDTLNFPLVIAILLATTGFVTITFHIRKLERLHRENLINCIIFALAATLCWSAGDIFVKKIIHVSPFTITLGSLFFAWIIYFTVIISLRKQKMILKMPNFDQTRYFIHGVLSLALAYFFLNLSLQKIGIIKTNIVTHAWPIIASLVGYFYYKEKLFFSKICGAIILLVSFILVALN